MHLSSLLLCLSLGALVKYVSASGSEWCYTGCGNTPSHWGAIPGAFCGGNKQSPIDIVTTHVKTDHNLGNFTFVNFTSKNVIKTMINNGHTAKCHLEENEVEVSGGGLNGTYSAIQFHFHWGDTEHHPGSEHKVDGHRYPMEMHIVTLKKGYNVSQAIADSAGIAVLGFFINATEDGDMTGPWSNLTSYLTNVTDTKVNITHNISIDDLIGNVDRTKFYRYMGSLTTPSCNEAVVWTVFQEPININKNLVYQFAKKTDLTNVFRPTQELHERQVYASPATPLPPSPAWCYDKHHCHYNPLQWYLLPNSHCGGERQSPINIDTKSIVTDERLNDFTFTKFDDKHAITHIVNTGHTVKCKVKEGLLEVSGGGLEHVYSTLQFHFHWGSDKLDGSEHIVDSRRYPMEMHIVNKKKDLELDDAVKASDGLAVLGFLIEPKDTTKSSSGSDHHESKPPSEPSSDMDAWKKLSNYLSSIQNISSEAEVKEEISIDDLLGTVDKTQYYRYNGSLTTPSCNEAVVWTVFKESIKIDKDVDVRSQTQQENHLDTIDYCLSQSRKSQRVTKFQMQVGYHNVYRPTQPLHSRKIYATKSASSAPGPNIVFLLLACLCAYFM